MFHQDGTIQQLKFYRDLQQKKHEETETIKMFKTLEQLVENVEPLNQLIETYPFPPAGIDIYSSYDFDNAYHTAVIELQTRIQNIITKFETILVNVDQTKNEYKDYIELLNYLILIKPSLDYVVCHINDRNQERQTQNTLILQHAEIILSLIKKIYHIPEYVKENQALETKSNNTEKNEETNDQVNHANYSTLTIENNVSPLLSLPDETLLNIVNFLPKNRAELVPFASTCHVIFSKMKDPRILKMFPLGYDYAKLKSTKTSDKLDNKILTSTLSSDGKIIAVSVQSPRGKICLLDAHTGKLINTLEEKGNNNSSYTGICFSKDNKHILACSEGEIHFWNIEKNERDIIDYSLYRTSKPLIVCLSENEFAFASRYGNSLQIVNINLHISQPFLGDDGKEIFLASLSSSQDGNLLCIIEEPSDYSNFLFKKLNLKIYDIQNKKMILTLPLSEQLNVPFSFSKDNKSIFCKRSETISYLPLEFSGNKETIQKINLDNQPNETIDIGIEVQEFDIFAISKSDRYIAFVSHAFNPPKTDRIHIFDTKAKKIINQWEMDDKIQQLFFSADDDGLITISDNILYIYKFEALTNDVSCENSHQENNNNNNNRMNI